MVTVAILILVNLEACPTTSAPTRRSTPPRTGPRPPPAGANIGDMDLLTPVQSAAHWFSRKLGRLVDETEVELVDLGESICGSLLPSRDALCLRPSGHPGAHESFRYADDQGRQWRVTQDNG